MASHISRSLFELPKSSLGEACFAIGVVFSLVGYNVALVLAVNLMGSTEESRLLSIPIRLAIVGFLFFAALLIGKRRNHPGSLWFLAFCSLYLIRIFFEFAGGANELYRTPLEFLVLFLSFVLLPFLFISTLEIPDKVLAYLYNWLVTLHGIFGVVVAFYYGGYLGNLQRVSSVLGDDPSMVSPLILSYQAALGLGLVAFGMGAGRVSVCRKFFLIGVGLLLFIPLALGASRGSVFVLAVVITFFLLFLPSLKRRFFYLVVVIFAFGGFLYAQGSFGYGLANRVVTITEDIEAGSSSAVRLEFWESGFNQFFSSPLFGNDLQLVSIQHYPHNLVIEILISTGVIGLAAFGVATTFVLKESVRLVRKSPKSSWVVVVFLSGLTYSMFSGSIATASILATGMGLVLATAKAIDRRRSHRSGGSDRSRDCFDSGKSCKETSFRGSAGFVSNGMDSTHLIS